MKIIVKGKNIELTTALKAYAEKKVGKLAKFFPDGSLTAEVVLSVRRELHVAEVTAFLNGLILRGEETTEDMYASIDGVVDKIERQIHKYKTRINRRARGERLASQTPEAVLEEPGPKIVRTKRFPLKPMTIDEAIMQMDLLDHDFFVFANSETEEVNVVYKRRDGNYGLIEPEV